MHNQPREAIIKFEYKDSLVWLAMYIEISVFRRSTDQHEAVDFVL